MALNKELSETLTSNTSTSTITWDLGRGVLVGYGNFDGGTATLEATPDGGTTWIEVTSELATGSGKVDLSSNGMVGFFLPQGMDLRVTLSGATSPDVNIDIIEVAQGDLTL